MFNLIWMQSTIVSKSTGKIGVVSSVVVANKAN